MGVAEILRQVAGYSPHYVTVTGGEPLAQKNCLPLLRALCDTGYEVSLETGGALDIGEVDARVMRVVDIKTPASGEAETAGKICHCWPGMTKSSCWRRKRLPMGKATRCNIGWPRNALCCFRPTRRAERRTAGRMDLA